MKKNNKGFTLIELLVVVAIIGILAAVGTVAYTGYTKNAKKSAAKSNHASVVKYVAAELQKCNMDETEAMAGELTCSTKSVSGNVQAAAIAALASFKNPYDTAKPAVGDELPDGATSNVGYVFVTEEGSDVEIVTCYAELTVGDADPACVADDPTSTMTNTIAIE